MPRDAGLRKGTRARKREMRSYQRATRRSTRRNGANPCLVALSGLALVLFGGLVLDNSAGIETPRIRQRAGSAAPYPRGLPAGDGRFYFLGSDTCRTCHRELYEAWQTSQHTLSGADLSFEEQRDPDCQPCHLPGIDAFEESVGCEACHGPGSAYTDLDIMIDPVKNTAAGLWTPEETCRYCHNPGHPFHVERDLEAEARRIHPPANR